METLLVVAALVILIFFLFNKKSPSNINKKNSKKTTRISINLMQPIRKGYQVFFQNMSVEGIHLRKEAASNFIEDKNLTLRLEAESNNVNDINALKLIGQGSRGDYFLGYVPKECALKIAKTNCYPYVYARLIRFKRSESNFIEITFQIIGQRDKKEQFDSYEKNLPITKNQKDYLKFWEITYDKEITTFNAQKIIDDHHKAADTEQSEKMIVWNIRQSVQSFYEIFSDKDDGTWFDIKKPTKKQIALAVNALLTQGVTIEAMEEDYELLADKLTDLFPELY
jgi:hypothetical protein